jgi:hypothetical protein
MPRKRLAGKHAMHATKKACFSKTASMHGVLAADRTPNKILEHTVMPLLHF